MIQRVVKIKSASWLPTKDGKKTYLSVILSDGKKDNKYSIFDPALQKVLQEAGKSGVSVNIGLDKEGEFWNIKTAEITDEVITQSEPIKENKADRYGKHSDKDSEVESSKRCALMQATDIYVHCTEVGTPFDEDLFKDLCKICKREVGIENPLVEEAKKLGGEEK